jgi:hypothetical protein
LIRVPELHPLRAAGQIFVFDVIYCLKKFFPGPAVFFHSAGPDQLTLSDIFIKKESWGAA